MKLRTTSMEITMVTYFKKQKFLAIITTLYFITALPVKAGDNDDFLKSEEARIPLKTAFTHELKFSTDMGELTLSFENNPQELNLHFLNPQNLPKSMDFISISHKKFLSSLDDFLAPKTTADQSTITDSDNDSIPESEDSAQEPPLKHMRLLQDNAAYPLKFQSYNFFVKHQFALADSVLSVNWSFETKDVPYDYADLNIFSESNLFYEYAKNSFANYLKKQTELIEETKFAQVRGLMYL